MTDSMIDAVQTWASEVVGGVYPGPEHQYR